MQVRMPAPVYYLGRIIQLTPFGFVVYERSDSRYSNHIGPFTDIFGARNYIDQIAGN